MGRNSKFLYFLIRPFSLFNLDRNKKKMFSALGVIKINQQLDRLTKINEIHYLNVKVVDLF